MSGAAIPPLPDAVPPFICSIVAKALMHDPAHRFQSARELGMALEDAMSRLGLGTTSMQVAQLLTERIGDRLQERRDFVQSALAEAANRERVRGMLLTAPTVDADGSGSLRQMQPVAIPPDLGASPHMMAPQMHYGGAMNYAPTTNQTLAATTVEPLSKPSRGGPSRAVVFGALFVSLAMAAGGGVMIVRARSASAQKVAASAQATASAGAVVTAATSTAPDNTGVNAMPVVDMSQVGTPPVVTPAPVVAAAQADAGAATTAKPSVAAVVPAVAAAAKSPLTPAAGPKPAAVPWAPAKPAAAPTPKKPRDDEAGF